MSKKQAPLWLFCCLFATSVSGVATSVRLVNNGYEGVTVYIASAVQEDLSLIYEIKDMMTRASHLLFFATKNRAYFRNITIVVPKHWTSVAENTTVPTVNKFDSHIRIDKPSTSHGHRPYVRGNLKCGESAWYMHLTPSLVKWNEINTYGEPDKAVVHEWGHLRWGLFDEYASITYASTAPYKVQYYNGGGRWNAVTCPKAVSGNAYSGNCNPNQPCNVDNLTIDKTCKFCPDTQQTVTGSYMAHQWMPSVVRFCEEDSDSTPSNIRHDSKAPNLQNKMCNGRSAWEVMLEHEDFAGANNPPVTTIEEPAFVVAKERSKVRVFVYDVSGSMNSNSKITKQKDASYVVIDTVVEAGSYLGLVKFNRDATILASIREVASTAVRDQLKLLVPTTAGGGTQIYNGLNRAILAIENGGFTTEGSEIVLLSDGMSNSPYMHINATLIDKGIIVHTISITNAADPLMTLLAEMTGGKSYTYLETNSVSFVDVFSQAVTVDTAVKMLSSFVHTISSRSPITGVFYIDEGMGNDTTLTVIKSTSSFLTINITTPDGSSNTTQGSTNVVSLRLNGIAQVGQYSFFVKTSSSYEIEVEVKVSSSPSKADVDIIDVTSFINSSTLNFSSPDQVVLTVEVTKGQAPVLNASVTALLAADSSYTPLLLNLSDSGTGIHAFDTIRYDTSLVGEAFPLIDDYETTGADTIYGDGIYNTYLLKGYFTVDSAYNIKIIVEAHGEAYIQILGQGADAIPGTVDETNVTNTDVGTFTRQSIPGEITTKNFVRNPADTTPPAQIIDLRVEDIYKTSIGGVDNLVYTLAWTAVGSDMDVGQATFYDMRYHANIHTLTTSFNSTSQVPRTLPSPQVSGMNEIINITFTHQHCVGICYVALTATDENGLSGDVSNIINVDIDFSYIVEDVAVVEDSTKKSIVLLLVLITLGVAVALAILGGVIFKVLNNTGKALGSKKVDPVFKMEQADKNEKQSFSYYDQNHKDAVVPFDSSDFNSRPSFSESIHLKDTWMYPDARPFGYPDEDQISSSSFRSNNRNGSSNSNVEPEEYEHQGNGPSEFEYVDPLFAVETCDGNTKNRRFVSDNTIQ